MPGLSDWAPIFCGIFSASVLGIFSAFLFRGVKQEGRKEGRKKGRKEEREEGRKEGRTHLEMFSHKMKL